MGRGRLDGRSAARTPGRCHAKSHAGQVSGTPNRCREVGCPWTPHRCHIFLSQFFGRRAGVATSAATEGLTQSAKACLRCSLDNSFIVIQSPLPLSLLTSSLNHSFILSDSFYLIHYTSSLFHALSHLLSHSPTCHAQSCFRGSTTPQQSQRT